MRLNPKQASQLVPCSPALIYQWCQEGLPHYRLGGEGKRGRILIEVTDLVAFLEAHKITPTLSSPGELTHIRLPS
jgi:hypothetical protein